MSLTYLHEDESVLRAVLEDQRSDLPYQAQFMSTIERFSPKKNVFAAYTAEEHPRRIPNGWEEDILPGELALVDAVISTFNGVSQRWEANGDKLRWYKDFNPVDISRAIESVEWRQLVPLVGGDLVSELILKHALPNANHRTAIAFLRTYLESIAQQGEADFPAAGNYDGEWYRWAEEYVYRSKKLLLLRRKDNLLRYAKDHGFSKVQREPRVTLTLAKYDFNQTAVSRHAEKAHLELWVDFVVNFLIRSGQSNLLRTMDPGKQTFVRQLR